MHHPHAASDTHIHTYALHMRHPHAARRTFKTIATHTRHRPRTVHIKHFRRMHTRRRGRKLHRVRTPPRVKNLILRHGHDDLLFRVHGFHHLHCRNRDRFVYYRGRLVREDDFGCRHVHLCGGFHDLGHGFDGGWGGDVDFTGDWGGGAGARGEGWAPARMVYVCMCVCMYGGVEYEENSLCMYVCMYVCVYVWRFGI